MMDRVLFENIRKEIISSLQLCKAELKIAVAWFTDKKIITEIEKLIVKGINVNIIIYDNHINKKDLYKKLYYGGANIFLSKKMMHNKFCVIDNKVVINGSYNWTLNASHNNDENIQITIDNNEIAEDFLRQFDKIRSNCRTIDDYFEYSLDHLNQLDNEIKENLINYNEKPYFYYLEGLRLSEKNLNFSKLKSGYYLIRDSEEEYEFFRVKYLVESRYSIIKINNLQKKKIELPPFFDYVDLDTKKPNEFYKFSNEYVKVEVWGKYNYVYHIDKYNYLIGEKILYHYKLPNGNYLYTLGFPSMKHNLYSNSLKNLKLNLYHLELKFEIGILGDKKVKKFDNSYKFGLLNFDNKVIVEFIYDTYKIYEEEGTVYFIELPHLYCDTYRDKISFLSKKLEKNRVNLTYSKITKYDYVNKKIISHRYVENKKGDLNNYLFLSDENFTYLELYQAFMGYGQNYKFIDVNNIRISDFKKFKKEFKEGYNKFKNGYCGKSFLKSQDEKLEALDEYYELRGLKKKEEKKEGCYIATMVYKFYNDPNVVILRNYRDDYLKGNYLGEKFIDIYYNFSPKFVTFAENKFLLSYVTKILVKIIVNILKKLNIILNNKNRVVL